MTEENQIDQPTEAEAPKKNRKLKKDVNYETGIITIEAIGGKKGPVTYNFNDLPAEMQKKLGPFGMSHKLGDAASSVKGVEAEESIARVWEGMKKNEWSTRGPATPKIAISEIVSNLDAMTPAMQKKAKEALAALGIALPEEPTKEAA